MVTSRRSSAISLEHADQIWERIAGVMTRAPLGLQDQLEGILSLIGCDCILLASSRHTRELMDNDEWEWRIHRVSPIKYAGIVPHNAHPEAMGLEQLFGTLSSLAAPMRMQDDSGFHFADWGCQSNKSKIWYDQMPEHCRSDFKLSMAPPIEIRIDSAKYLATHVGLVLLGSVNIGRWELGESYLVCLDLEEEHAASPCPRRWVSTMQMEYLPFLVYLAEVSLHFNCLEQLNRLQPSERLRRIEEMTHIEREAYCQAATRLTPLLSSDLVLTSETLAQIDSVWGHEAEPPVETAAPGAEEPTQLLLRRSGVGAARDTTDQEGKLASQRIEAVFKGFAQSSFPILEDRQRSVPPDEIRRRSDHVQRQIEWTRIWWKCEELYHQSQHHRDGSYEDWSHRLTKLLSQVKDLISQSPLEAWFHLGVEKDDQLMLTGASLAGFLVTQVIAHSIDRIDPDQLKLSGFSDSRGLEVLTFGRNFICVARYALGCIPADQRVLQSLLWLLSEIGHTRFGVDRELDFEKHLYLSAMEQPALYALKAFYRDHLNHVIQVCLTGWLILETEFEHTRDGNCAVADRFLSTGQNREELMRQWFVASLLHDVGYVIDIGTGWADLLDKFEDKEVLGVLSKATRKTIEDWSSCVDTWKGWDYRSEDRPGEDHGVVSALHVQNALAKITNASAADYSAALTAIAHHNHPKAKIRFQEEKLSVLLVLCDELQEWNRPWLELDRAGLALSTVVAFDPAHTLRWHKPLSKVTTNLRTESTPNTPSRLLFKIAGAIFDFSINYSPDIHRNHSIFNAWLGRSRSLGRIELGDTDQCPLDFRFRMKSPVAPPGALFDRDASEPELARLWRIVRDQRIWSIHRWLEAASNGKVPPQIGGSSTGQGVLYTIDNETKSEILVLDVRPLARESLISGDLNEIWEKIAGWRYAHESMDESPI